MAIRDTIRPIKHLQNKYFTCVLENPKDIMNIAATMRNVSAFGVEKLYVIGNKEIVKDFETARTNKKLANLSVGANKWVFVKQFDTTAECISHLLEQRYTIMATSSHLKGKKNISLYEGDFTDKRIAVWFGNESAGASDEVLEAADVCIQIPMGGIVESLNLGTSTGIVLSFISNQRLQFIYENKKVNFKPKSLAKSKMRSWHDFMGTGKDS